MNSAELYGLRHGHFRGNYRSEKLPDMKNVLFRKKNLTKKYQNNCDSPKDVQNMDQQFPAYCRQNRQSCISAPNTITLPQNFGNYKGTASSTERVAWTSPSATCLDACGLWKPIHRCWVTTRIIWISLWLKTHTFSLPLSSVAALHALFLKSHKVTAKVELLVGCFRSSVFCGREEPLKERKKKLGLLYITVAQQLWGVQGLSSLKLDEAWVNSRGTVGPWWRYALYWVPF